MKTKKTSDNQCLMQFRFINEINIENFRTNGASIAKENSSFFFDPQNANPNYDTNNLLYHVEEVEVGRYSQEDIEDWNKYLWVDKELLLKVKKLLRPCGYKANLYPIITAFLMCRDFHLYSIIPKDEIKKEHSVIRLIHTLEELNDELIAKRNLNIKSENLKSFEKFDFESLVFIKNAINFYKESPEGKIQVENILAEHNDRVRFSELIKQQKEFRKEIKKSELKRHFIYCTNQLLMHTCKDVKIRLTAIGGLIDLIYGRNDRGDYYNNLRKFTLNSNL